MKVWPGRKHFYTISLIWDKGFGISGARQQAKVANVSEWEVKYFLIIPSKICLTLHTGSFYEKGERISVVWGEFFSVRAKIRMNMECIMKHYPGVDHTDSLLKKKRVIWNEGLLQMKKRASCIGKEP